LGCAVCCRCVVGGGRYIPVGLLEVVPQQMQWRPPAYSCRNQLEGLLSSESASDWVKISEMLLGPVPPGFSFAPKHKSNAYSVSLDVVNQMQQATVGSAGGAELVVYDSSPPCEGSQENG
jgi:hypothetical protein